MTSTPPDPTDPDLRPGDEAHPGTEVAGENVCPDCGGSGQRDDGADCITCAGTGRVIEGVGGA
jgi:DnaJ-class molecular chaperone